MNDAAKLIEKHRLNVHLQTLRDWKAQIDYDLDIIQREQIQACVNSVKVESAIRDTIQKLKELE